MGILLLLVLFTLEIVLLIWAIGTKNTHLFIKTKIRIALIGLIAIAFITGILTFGFQYYGILIVLVIQVILGIVVFARKGVKPYSAKRVIASFIGCIFLYTNAMVPAVLFPQYKPIQTTGDYTVSTQEYVWTDENRVETFTNSGEKRFVNVMFWAPVEKGEYPLVVFSHGAFGVGVSNESTFRELASNGYVVASIGHPYHSFYTQDMQGKPALADGDFINSVYAVNAMDDGIEKQTMIDQWMKVRLGDMNFVLDTILQLKKDLGENSFWGRIDTAKIGVIGHSLGGATAAQIARERQDIDGVVVLDATMLGETIGWNKAQPVFNDTPYPVPIFTLYSQSHYEEAMLYGEKYENLHATANAVSSYTAVMKDAGHMNFTDLPLFSPILAGLLDSSSNTTGTADARVTVEKMNMLVLTFFNYTLKDGPVPEFEKEY